MMCMLVIPAQLTFPEESVPSYDTPVTMQALSYVWTREIKVFIAASKLEYYAYNKWDDLYWDTNSLLPPPPSTYQADPQAYFLQFLNINCNFSSIQVDLQKWMCPYITFVNIAIGLTSPKMQSLNHTVKPSYGTRFKN